MDIFTNKGKKELIKAHTPKSKSAKNCLLAFLFGGTICALGEAMRDILVGMGTKDKDALGYVSITLILIASLLTSLGIFDRIAKRAGAGTLVPITGFSNAVTSQAIDAHSEGMVMGVGAKIFTVAGPVILYGIAAGVVYGIIYYVTNLLLA